MKFNLLQLFYLHNRNNPLKKKSSLCETNGVSDKKINKKNSDLSPRNPFRDVEPKQKLPITSNKKGKTSTIRKSKSFSDIGQNVFTSIKRSTSYQKLSKNLHKRNGNLRIPLATLEEHKIETKSIYSNDNVHTSYSIDLREPSIIDFMGEGFGHDCLDEENTTNETYTSMFNSIYADYYLANDSDSVQSSAISEKQIVSQGEYLLSSSKTPNYAITPQLLPPFPSFATENPFADFDDFNQLPHEKLLLRASQIHGLSPTDSLSSAIKSYRRSLYCESGDFDFSNNDDELVFYNDRGSILPSPKIGIPCSPLPPLPNGSPAYSTPYHHNLKLRSINAEEAMDLDEKSLFDALSKAECWDCSKITLVTYND